MQIGRANAVDFRNYRTLSLTPARRLNVFSGPNGQGKTNLLEALGLLVTGRSFRTPRTAEIPRWGSRSTSVTGDLVRADGTPVAPRTVRRTIEGLDDGTWQNSGESVEWARAIAFGWQDLEIVNGAPLARRSFIDGFAGRLYPVHLKALIEFRQLLARRNRLLQQRSGDAATRAQLEPWNDQFATVGMHLVNRRRRAVAALQTELARVYGALCAARSKVEIRYRTALGEASDAAALLAALERARHEELRRGQTLVGPHRDDLGGRLAALLVDVHENAAAVIADGARAVGVQDDLDVVAGAGERLVHGVVDRLVDELVEAVRARVPDVHRGTLADGLKPLEDLDVTRRVALGAHAAATPPACT